MILLTATIAAETSTTAVNNAPSAPRPRLVAKTASGHQATASRPPGSTFRNGGGSGPDASQVWNRNRGNNFERAANSPVDELYQLPRQRRRRPSPTKNSSSSTVSILQPDYKQTEMARRPSGRISTMTRMTGHPTRSSGTMVQRLPSPIVTLLRPMPKNKLLPRHSRRSKRRRPRPRPPSQSLPQPWAPMLRS